MDEWRRNFVQKLGKAQSQWVKRFEDALTDSIVPVFDDFGSFVCNHGFRVSTPLREPGRRSFKFELAENAYLLLIFRSVNIGEFEMCSESFVPGREPLRDKSTVRIADADRKWSERHFRAALDSFVDALNARTDATPTATGPAAARELEPALAV
jgi:hypothetical protein